jgi:hypothetical protein
MLLQHPLAASNSYNSFNLQLTHHQSLRTKF